MIWGILFFIGAFLILAYIIFMIIMLVVKKDKRTIPAIPFAAVLMVVCIVFGSIFISRPITPNHSSNTSSFTNDYGTPDTICMAAGCTRKIATSGDTAYCTTHSGKCLNCRCYVDPDAMYCMDCIKDAIN